MRSHCFGAAALKQLGEKTAERPRLWVLCMLVSSYALLVPGLMMNLVSGQMSLSFFGVTMPMVLRRENTVEMVRNIADDGALMAASFVTAYAMVIPVLKVLLLVCGLAWQSGDAAKARWARRCILTVQVASKWASPDIFAYIVILRLIRGLHKPPHLLTDLQLELGFSVFCIFSLGSTVSSLCLRLPDPAGGGEPGKTASRPGGPAPRGAARGAGCLTLLAAGALAAAFAALLAVGVMLPCLELRLDTALLYANQPNLDPMRSFIDTLGLAKLLHEEVSVWQCLAALGPSILDGEVNGAIAFVMFGGFTLCLPLVDMLLLLVAACGLRAGLCNSALSAAMAASRVLRRLSMLDVAIMGIATGVLSLQGSQEIGLVLSMRSGLLALLGAALCHYCMAFLVTHAHGPVPVVEEEVRAGASSPRVWV